LPAFDDILRLAEQGDQKAGEAWSHGALLGAGLAMLMTALAPEVIVLIGEVTRGVGCFGGLWTAC